MTKLADFARQYKTWLFAAVFLLMTHVASYGLGNHHAEMRHARQATAAAVQQVDRAKEETRAVIDAGNKASIERVEVKVRDLARERALEASLSQMRSERDQLQRTLNEAPDYTSDCRLRIGDVRLLNYAARPGDFHASAGASNPADFASAQEQAPSTVSCRAFVSGEIDVRFQYAELAKQHDELVDWIEREVILPQLPVDSANPDQ